MSEEDLIRILDDLYDQKLFASDVFNALEPYITFTEEEDEDE